MEGWEGHHYTLVVLATRNGWMGCEEGVLYMGSCAVVARVESIKTRTALWVPNQHLYGDPGSSPGALLLHDKSQKEKVLR